MSHHHAHLDVVDNRVLDAQQDSAWGDVVRAVVLGSRQPKNLDRERRALLQARSTTHGRVSRAVKRDE